MRPMGFGDLIMLSDFFTALRLKHPNSIITLVSPYSIYDDSGLYDSRINKRHFFYSLTRYDLVCTLSKGYPQSLLALVQRSHQYCVWGPGWKLYSNTGHEYRYKANLPYFALAENLCKALGLVYTNNLVPVPCKEVVLPKKPYVVINPFVSWKSRRWSYDKYAELIQQLDCNIVIVCGPQERVEVKTAFAAVDCKKYLGTLNLSQTSYLLKHAAAVVTGDCGPMHIAMSHSVPVVSLWSVTVPKTRIKPSYLSTSLYVKAESYDLENIPLSSNIDEIKVGDVRDLVQKIIS